MLVSDFHRSLPRPSSSRASPCCTRPPTSAPHAGQDAGIGPGLSQERPLAGCRLSRRTVATGSPLCWPWSPFLPPRWSGLGPPFDGLPVVCDHPTSLVSSSSRYWFLDDYRRPAEAERSPQVRTRSFVPTPSSIRPPADGYRAHCRWPACPQDWTPHATLHFHSARHFPLDFHQTLPHGPIPSTPTSLSGHSRSFSYPPSASALVFIRSGFPPSGSPEDLAHCFTSNFAPMLGAHRDALTFGQRPCSASIDRGPSRPLWTGKPVHSPERGVPKPVCHRRSATLSGTWSRPYPAEVRPVPLDPVARSTPATFAPVRDPPQAELWFDDAS